MEDPTPTEEPQVKPVRYQYDGKRFWIILGALLLIWFSLLGFFYMKADEVTKDPCSVCAKRMGETVTCATETQIPAYRKYYANGSIANLPPQIVEDPVPTFSGNHPFSPGA